MGITKNFLISRLAKVITSGSLEIEGNDGNAIRIGDGVGQTIRIKDVSSLNLFLILSNPMWYVPYFYQIGVLEIIHGDLLDLICLSQNPKNTLPRNKRLRLFRSGSFYLSQINTPRISRSNSIIPYDKSEEFYKSFLDSKLTYSCAFYDEHHTTLEAAQENKIDTTIDRLDITEGMDVLDLGCGWGHLSKSIVEQKSVNVLGITLSTEQFRVCERNRNSTRLSYGLIDYRELYPSETSIFDRIVSVGMFEHAGKSQYDRFFDEIVRLLKKNGKALIHTIVRPFPGETSKWIDTFVFPGGYIASLGEIIVPIERSGLVIEKVYRHKGVQYVETLKEWRKRFRNNHPFTVDTLPEHRGWDFYLAASQSVFQNTDFGVAQIVMSKK